MFKRIDKEGFYYGFPVLLMTTKDSKTKEDNLTPISSTWTLGKSIVIGVGLHNKGYLNLEVDSELTLNVADRDLWENVERIGRTTGTTDIPAFKKAADYSFCSDKFQLGAFTKLPGKLVETVRIKECPIQLETKVTAIFIRNGYAIIECNIKGIFVEAGILYDETHIDVEKWQPLIYKFREYTTTGQTLGKNFKFQEFRR